MAKHKRSDSKAEKRIGKVLDYLGLDNGKNKSEESPDSLSDDGQSAERSEYCPKEASKVKRQVDNRVYPAMGNDIYRWNHFDALRRCHNKKKGIFKPNNLFDEMDNEFLLLFDHEKGYCLDDQFQKNRSQIFRRKYPNEYTIDPLGIKEDIQVMRETPIKRLKQFEEMRAKAKFRKLTERERQVIVRHIRTENVKKKFIRTMEWYLLTKLAEQRLRIREAEHIKYQKKVEEFLEKIPELEKKKMVELEETVKKKVQEEEEKAEIMKRALLSEEILITVDKTETEIKEKYEKFLLNLKLSDLSETYQLEMDVYSKFWKRKTKLLEIQMEEEQKATKRELAMCLIQRKLEILSEVEREWKNTASEILKQILQKVRDTVVLIPPKERELKEICEENEFLLNRIGHWKKIIPEYISQQEKFIQFSFKEIPQKEKLLESLNKLKEFKEPFPETIETRISSSKPSSTQVVSPKPVSELSGSPQILTMIDTDDYAMPLAQYYLSDGDFEESAKKLLQVKYIIVDLMRRILPSEESLQSYDETTVRWISTSSKDLCKPCHLSEPSLSKNLQVSLIVVDKLEEIVEVIEKTFEVVGWKFSVYDFTKPQTFIGKRTQSVKQILDKN